MSSQTFDLHYPLNGHATQESSVLLVGQVPPNVGCELTVNGEAQTDFHVSASGYLGGQAQLTLGENTLVLSVGSETLTRTVIRQGVTAVDQPKLTFPTQNIAGVAGFFCPIHGVSPSQHPLVLQPVGHHLLWGEQPRPVQQLIPAGNENTVTDHRLNRFGQLHAEGPVYAADSVFSGQWKMAEGVQQLNVLADEAVVYTLPVEAWPSPRWAQIVSETACRTAPTTEANRYKPLLTGTHVAVLAHVDDWVAVALPNNLIGWLDASAVDWLAASPPALMPVRNPIVQNETLSVTFPTGLPALQWQTQPDSLVATIGHAVAQCDVIPQPTNGELSLAQTNPTTTQLTWQQDHSQKGTPIAGVEFSVAPEKDWAAVNWQCRIKPLPKNPRDWRILLDPGHGGEETGAIAPNGQTEAELNLAIALACQKALNDAGFGCVDLTRMGNVAVSLADRVQQADRGDYHLCLSLHHNALPDGRNPLNHQGLATFYYHGHARPLAKHLLTHVSEALNCPTDGLYWDNLAMTRIHTTIGVLLEWGYFTHPNEAERLLTPDFPQQAASALTKALLAFNPQA